jgi:response regulator RpfG family c-di-GMP phosphodiesterase
MASLLILEDSQVQLTRLKNDIGNLYPDLTIFPARSIEEAQLYLSEYDDIDAFLLDVFLPDGNGIDFLCDVKTILPEAHAIIMTANPVPEIRQHAQDLGVIRFFQKPLDMSILMEEFSKIIGPSAKPLNSGSNSDSFKASLGGLSTVDIIQLKCLARATQVIAFVRDDGTSGKIHFQRGEIVHAECNTGKNGLEAFNDIVSWRGGQVEESQESIAEPTIQQGWESLLMDAVRMIDEATLQ